MRYLILMIGAGAMASALLLPIRDALVTRLEAATVMIQEAGP